MYYVKAYKKHQFFAAKILILNARTTTPNGGKKVYLNSGKRCTSKVGCSFFNQ